MQYYFWRTYDQQEIDLAEVGNGLLHAYEFKWSAGAKAKLPEFFRKSYPESTFKIISKENYLEWIL